MKNNILTFVIGLLAGAIIATSGFLIYSKMVVNNSKQPEMMEMNGNGQMEGQQPGSMEEPPAKPDGDNGEEPPAKPEETNNNTTI